MLKNCILVIAFFLCLIPANSVSVQIDADVGFDYTYFTYKFYFNKNESFRSFSFEKPSDAKLDSAIDNLNYAIKYSQSGDFFVFQPENTANKYFEIKMHSRDVSEKILAQNLFLSYQKFNFPVDSLLFNFELKDYLGNISEIYPRNYELQTPNQIYWNLSGIEKDTLFFVNFNSIDLNLPNQSNIAIKLLSLSMIFLLFSFLLVYFYFKKSKKSNLKSQELLIKNKETLNYKDSKLDEFSEQNSNIKENHFDQNRFEEITNKFLTDNEKEVVTVVRDNEGISQFDILNFLPRLTKSNLSKIIAKLNSRKILKRIRVGKVNKIYLGEKLEKNNSEFNE